MKLIQTVFVSLFTIINGYIILPYTFKKIEQINNDEIEEIIIKKSIIILLIIILTLSIIETSYLKSVQYGILSIINR